MCQTEPFVHYMANVGQRSFFLSQHHDECLKFNVSALKCLHVNLHASSYNKAVSIQNTPADSIIRGETNNGERRLHDFGSQVLQGSRKFPKELRQIRQLQFQFKMELPSKPPVLRGH